MFIYVSLAPTISPLEGFEYLSSSPFQNGERVVGLQWNSSAGVLQYTLSCSNEECMNETFDSNEDDVLVSVFTMDEVVVTLTALYQCTTNTSTAQVTVPAITAPAPTPTTPVPLKGISSIRCTYF